jgi:hypothetical protein
MVCHGNLIIFYNNEYHLGFELATTSTMHWIGNGMDINATKLVIYHEVFRVLIISSFGLDYGENYVLALEDTLSIMQPWSWCNHLDENW